MSNIQRAFKASLPGLNYVFKNGDIAQFIVRDTNGVGLYHTDDEEKIAELEQEVKKGNPYIYIDPKEKEVDIEALTPMARLRKQIRAEILAEELAKTNPANNMGVYENVTTAARSIVTTRSATGQETPDEQREILLADTRQQQAIAQQLTGVGQVATPDNGASAVFTDENTVVVDKGAGGTETVTLPDAAAGAEQVQSTQPVTGANQVSSSSGTTGKLTVNLNKQLGGNTNQ